MANIQGIKSLSAIADALDSGYESTKQVIVESATNNVPNPPKL